MADRRQNFGRFSREAENDFFAALCKAVRIANENEYLQNSGRIFLDMAENLAQMHIEMPLEYKFQLNIFGKNLKLYDGCESETASFDFIGSASLDILREKVDELKALLFESDKYIVQFQSTYDVHKTQQEIRKKIPELAFVYRKAFDGFALCLWRLKRIAFTYGMEEQFSEQLRAKYGAALQIYSCTDEWRDMMALDADIIVINQERFPEAARAAFDECYQAVSCGERPEIIYLDNGGVNGRG